VQELNWSWSLARFVGAGVDPVLLFYRKSGSEAEGAEAGV